MQKALVKLSFVKIFKKNFIPSTLNFLFHFFFILCWAQLLVNTEERETEVALQCQSTIIMQLEFHFFLPLFLFLSCYHRTELWWLQQVFSTFTFQLFFSNDPFACHFQSQLRWRDKIIAEDLSRRIKTLERCKLKLIFLRCKVLNYLMIINSNYDIQFRVNEIIFLRKNSLT